MYKITFKSSARKSHNINGIDPNYFEFVFQGKKVILNNTEINVFIDIEISEKNYKKLEEITDNNKNHDKIKEGFFTSLMGKEYRNISNLAVEINYLLLFRYYELEGGKPKMQPLMWSIDGETWRSVEFGAIPVYWRILRPASYKLSAEIVQKNLEDLGEVPLSFVVLREAHQLMYNNPNASAILAYTALEVGCKEFWFPRSPGLEDLFKETQLPPIYKLLENTFPKIEEKFRIDSEVCTKIRNFGNSRNTLTHQGKVQGKDYEVEKLVEIFMLIEDILYYFEYVSGGVWVQEHIRRREKFLL